MTLPSIALFVLQDGGPAEGAKQTAQETWDPIADWLRANDLLWLSNVVRVAIIIVAAVVLRLLARWLIQRMVRRMVDAPLPTSWGQRKRGQRAIEAHQRITEERRDQRAKTVGQVIGSVASIVIFGTAVVMVLGELGVSIGPLIAGAGIIGVALGFGAQSLVSDFLSGIFMLMEDQYGVGDWIDAGEATGAVEHVGLRVTQLRDGDGVLWFVRNGEIVRIGNHSQDWARAVIDIPVAYGENVERVSELLKQTAWTLWEDEQFTDVVLEEPEIWGVEVLSKEAVVIRLAVKTAPLEQWGVARELRVRIKDAFDRRGVQIPFQLQTVWINGPDQQGPSRGDGGADRHRSPAQSSRRGE